MTRSINQTQNRIFPMTVNRNDATICPMRRDRHSVCFHAFASETGANALTESVIANRRDKTNRRSATRGGDRLIGALAAEVFRSAESHDRLTGPRESLHSNHAVDRGVADHMDHLCPLSATVGPRQRARCSAEKTRRGFSTNMWSMVR